MSAITCCTKPKLYRAWVPFKPFGRAVCCHNCGEVTIDMRPVGNFFWELFIMPFWNGRVEVERDPLQSEDEGI